MKITPLESWTAKKIGAGDGRLTREKIHLYQLAKLNETLHLASEKSSFYREHLSGAPPDISGLEDMARVPFTTPADIATSPLRFLCVSQDEIRRVVTLSSSGTTGKPKRLYFTADDQELTVDFFHVGMSTLAEPGYRVLILLPGGRPGSVGDLLQKGLVRLGAIGVKHGPVRDASYTLEVAHGGNIHCMVGIPTHVLRLVRCGENLHHIKSVLLTTDHVPDAILGVVEGAWGCKVYNHYGMTEMGLGGGVECDARRGYHLREADMYFEIVDPVTGRPLEDGETGEVVFTTLTRRGMPLIRYRTGDLSRFIPGDCPCGTALKTLERVRCRMDGIVGLGRAGHITIADLDEALFPIDGLLDFSAAVDHAEGKDLLHIRVNTVGGCGDAIIRAAEGELYSIQAVGNAARAGTLDLRVEAYAVDLTVERGSAKRSITDMRTRTRR